MSALNFNIAANEPKSLEELNAMLETSTAQQRVEWARANGHANAAL